MSKRLTYEVSMSRHPLLMADPVARDVLWWMADAAQERNECRIIMSVPEIAGMTERGVSAVRFAQKRMQEAGLLVEQGRGDLNKSLIVFRIAEDVLSNKGRFTAHDQSPRNDSGIAANPEGQPRSDRAAAVLRPRSGRAATALQPRSDHVPLARARLEQEQEQELEQEPNTENAGVPAGTPATGETTKGWRLPAHPLGDALLAKLNASASMQRVEIAARSLPVDLADEPTAIEAPKAATPGQARLAAAVDEVMGIIAPKGQTPATLETWRNRLKTRLAAKGLAADAVEDRGRAVKAAWAFIQANAWHIENGRANAAHFFTVTLRNDANVDRDAAKTPERQVGKWGKPAPAPAFKRAGLPTAADQVAAQIEIDEAAELARLEADAMEQRARIEAAAPKPPPPVVAPQEQVAAPEKVRSVFAEMNGLFGGGRK